MIFSDNEIKAYKGDYDDEYDCDDYYSGYDANKNVTLMMQNSSRCICIVLKSTTF